MAYRQSEQIKQPIDNVEMYQPLIQENQELASSLPNQKVLEEMKYGNIKLFKQPSSSKSKLSKQQSKSEAFSENEEIGEVLRQLFDDGDEIKGYKNQPDNQDQQKSILMKCVEDTPVYLPNQIGMLIWKGFMAGIILLYFFIIPVTITYTQEVWKQIGYYYIQGLNMLSFVALSLDILLEFITAYYEHGNFITQKDKIAHNYIHTFFFLDLIATLTFGIISSLNSESFNYFYLLFYLKYPSLMKIDYLFEELTLLHRTLRTMYNFGKIIILLQFCFLMFACIFYLIGQKSVENEYNSWLLNDGNFGVINNMTPGFQFFFSYYFALGTMTTTMGYGDITPLNVFECTWCLGGIIFAVFIFQVNVNSLFKIMEEFNIFPLKIYRQRVAINRFMRSKNVPQPVQERVRRFLNENWYEEGNRDTLLENQIITTLPPEIKEELLFNSYGVFFQDIPMFIMGFSRDFLKVLSQFVEEINYSINEIIFQDRNLGQNDDYSFYYIYSGKILIHLGQQYWLNQLTDKQYFGEWSFLTGMDRMASAQAISYSTLYKISRKNLLMVLDQFPDDFENYWMMRDKVLFQQDLRCIQQQCWTCGKSNHYSSQCDYTHYHPQIHQLIDLQPSNFFQERQPFERSHRDRWDTIRKSEYLTKITSNIKGTKLVQDAKNIIKTKERENMIDSYKKKEAPIKNMSQQAGQVQKEFKIHGNLKDIDRPYQFKNYFIKNNYQAISAFSNQSQSIVGLGRSSTIIGVRQSMLIRKV